MNWFQRLFARKPRPAPVPTTVAVTFEEGGNWHRFPCPEMNGAPRGITVHSIAFSNGRIWDAFNGWRPDSKNDQDRLYYIRKICR